MQNTFMGKDGFFWWFGVVESNADPLALGRCRVRVTGWHNPNDQELFSEALPWAYPITSLNNGGTGSSPIGPQPGTRVFGFFADGEAGQQPIMLGTVPGNTVAENKRALEYGSTPAQPITDSLFSPLGEVFGRETDSPNGTAPEQATVNATVPNQAQIDIDKGEWVIPFTGFVSSAYAEARAGYVHKGVDICPAGFYPQTDPGAKHLGGKMRGPTGYPVVAAADGVVVYKWTADKGLGNRPTSYDLNGRGTRSYGNAIAIRHTLSTGTYTTIYAHLGTSQDPSKDRGGSGILVNVGDKVTKGQQIGTVGRSHNRDTPTHLHFELRVGAALPAAGNHINPGRIFPQLLHRHTSMVSWVNTTLNYNVKRLPYDPSDAPCIAGRGPSV